MLIPQELHRDANNTPLDRIGGVVVKKTITFDGGTTNAIGDHDGTNDPFTIFNVTGTVVVAVFGVCTTDLVGATATLEVGVTDGTDQIIPQVTATDIDANEIWYDSDPGVLLDLPSVSTIIGNGLDIIGTVGTANITAGVIDFYCIYFPISEDGKVTAA